ncbi:hypothetical protein C8F01DRAFT_1365430 [Mycena amicta]|nr:hypothetical protein C8F01DRAFT_1365430 [Mycena amicta]
MTDAKSTLSSLDDELSSLHQRIIRLNTQRTQLEYFISTQSALVSGVRCLSNEILLEIFSHCTNPVYPPFHQYNPISKLLQVSSRWRAVAIACADLWKDVTLTDGLHLPPKTLMKQLALQMKRANQAPLSILLRAGQGTLVLLPLYLLDLVISASARWQKADIHLPPSHLQHLFAEPIPVFGMLTKLSLVINMGSGLKMSPEEFLTLFPSLVEFTLRMGYRKIPPEFNLLWERLRRCRLEECNRGDVLKILPVLSQDCHLVLKACVESNSEGEVTSICRVSSLSIMASPWEDILLSEMLHSIVATANLTKLYLPASPTLDPSAQAFLGRSSCPLSHLRLQTRNRYDPSCRTLIELLASPELYHLQHLDLTLYQECNATSVLDFLLKAEVLPHLETLAIRGKEVDFEWVVALHKARQSVLRRLGVPRPGRKSIPKLRLDGLAIHFCSLLGSDEALIPVTEW